MGKADDRRKLRLLGESVRLVAGLVAAAAASATTFMLADIVLLLVNGGTGDPAFVLETIGFLWPISFFVAMLHAAFLGLPAGLIARWRGWTQWWMSLVGGFAVGALPYAILALPWREPPDPDLVTAQIVRSFSWLAYFEVVAGLGALGLPGGITAWFTWRRLGSGFARRRASRAQPP